METAEDTTNGIIIWYSHHVLDNVTFFLLPVVIVVVLSKKAYEKNIELEPVHLADRHKSVALQNNVHLEVTVL